MTEFRKNLEHLKQDYQSIQYPGDLASEVPLAPERSMRLQVGSLLALAAAIAIAVTVWMMPDQTTPEIVVQKPTPEVLPDTKGIEDGEASLIVAMPSVQRSSIEVPTWSGVSPSVQSSSTPLSMPYQSLSMPTMSEIDSAISSTTDQSS